MNRILTAVFMLVVLFGFAPNFATAQAINSDPTAFKWNIFPEGEDANVGILGTGGQTLRLNIGMDEGFLSRTEEAVLSFNFRVAHNSGRRLLVWTDLSGTAEEIENFSFATSARIDAGKISVSDPLPSGTSSAKVKIPASLLYDSAAGKTARVMYVLFCTDEGPNGKDSDQFAVEGNQRGAKARKGVNGINLDREFDILETAKLTIEIDETAFTWKGFPSYKNVFIEEKENHVLKLSGLAIDNTILLGSKGASLEINYRVAHNSQRRILAWTNLSGPAEVAFATTDNLASGKVAVSGTLTSGTNFASVTLPKDMLANTKNGQTASEVYVLLCVDKGEEGLNDAYTDAATNQRGGSKRNGVNGLDLSQEFDIFDTVKLKVNYVSFVSRISLTPGSDASQMNFAWFTQTGTAEKAIVELAQAAEVANGVMSESALTFTGVTASGIQEYDTNKATVTGLKPDTEYAYRVGDGKEWSPVYTFKTGNPDGAYSVIATADPQLATAKDAEAWKNTIEKAVAKAGNASFMLNAGDLGDKSNSMEQYGWITSPKLLRSLPFATAIGNHDTFDFLGEPHEQIGLMPLHYNWPNHTELQVTEGDKPFIRAGGNYFFSYGNTLYIVLNSNVKDIEIHRDFMTKTIASNPNRVWTVALLHHDIYGTGDHAGTAYQDSQKMQPTWSPFLDEFGVDIAFTGHDHVYARSLFMKDNKVQNDQMSAKMDPVGINIREKNPGAYIQPKGILYMALSASACEKMYAPEQQDWVAYTHGMLGVPEYSIITIEGDSLTFTSYRSDTDEATDSITLRKKATKDDLASLTADAEKIQFNTNIVSGWDTFQSALDTAKTALSTTGDIHDAYVELYDAYFAITLNTDKTKLKTVIDEVDTILASASEGMWKGQYPEGSKSVLQASADAQTLVYTNKMATQEETDNAAAILQSKFDAFKASVSVIDIPWSNVHSIIASGINQIELVGWKNGGMQDAYVVKQEFAKDKLGGKRSSPDDGPANGLGGRGPSDSHITKTNIGEWIRYELAVEKAGMYKAMLGAANSSGKVQKVLLRDSKNDTLCTFTIPSDAVLPSGGWNQAPMISSDKDFYLSEGTYILELYFVNDAVGISVSSAANVAYPNDSHNVVYPDGANIDILTLERIGDGTPPTDVKDPAVFALPLPPTSIQGAPARQKGWASEGYVDDQGNVVTGISLDVFMAAKTLVLEVAARPASTNIQLHLIPEGDTSIWAANESTPNNTPALVMDTLYQNGKLVFPLDQMLGYKEWINSKKQCMIDISYYSYGWDDMNVMKAYFIVDPARMPKTETTYSSAKTTSIVPSKLISREDLTKIVPPIPEAGTNLSYTVQKGETWWSIAFNYYGSMDKTVTDKIKNANKNLYPSADDHLKPGDTITLPGEGIMNPVTLSSLNSMAGIYVVKAGDTLAQLAKKYYGSAALWKNIYEANKDRVIIVNNIPMIYEKQWLVIPE